MKKLLVFLLFILFALVSCTIVPKTDPLTETPLSSPVPVVTASAIPEPTLAKEPDLQPTVVLPGLKKFQSSGKGEAVSKYITTGDLDLFFTLEPKELISLLGGDYDDIGFVDDYGVYIYHYDYLGISLWYDCMVTDSNGSTDEKPVLPLKNVLVHSYQFRNLTNDSDYNAIMEKLGKTRILTLQVEDSSAYALQYSFGKLNFEFMAYDEAGSEGTGLEISPVIKYEKYLPVDVKEIGQWFDLSKSQLIERLGTGYTVEEDESGISGVYNKYTYKNKGIALQFEMDKLSILKLDGRYQVGGENKAKDFTDIQKVLGKGIFEETADDPINYTLLYVYKNFKIEFSSYEKDGFNFDMEISSLSD